MKLICFLLLAMSFPCWATTVKIQTTLGDIYVELYDAAAPRTVANFLNYVNSGAYRSTLIHRSIPGFIIQGGGFVWVGDGSSSVNKVVANPPVVNEYSVDRPNVRGTIAMAKVGGDPNSATNQWFINLADNTGNLDHQNGGFTVFGLVIGTGMEVADAIAALSTIDVTLSNIPFKDFPVITNSSGAQSVVRVSDISVLPAVVLGWNLMGNSTSYNFDVTRLFGDINQITSVWKWNGVSGRWAFYAPGLSAQQLADYAASQGYEALSSIGSGEGFWLNSKQGFILDLLVGDPVKASYFQNHLASGWNLISIGETKTPSEFNVALSQTPPVVGEIPLNFTSLWAWDASQTTWYFYAPSLEKSGGLASYNQSKSYLDFLKTGKKLGPGIGFWVH